MLCVEKPADRIPVGVLGATGIVGQRLIQLLSQHPWFRLMELVASPGSSGRLYRDAARWVAGSDGDVPADVADTILQSPEAELASPILFSALGSDVAAEFEPLHAQRGHSVISNASAFRTDPQVPLLIPEVNPETLDLLAQQKWSDRGGGIVTNPNCCVVGLSLALAPLEKQFGIEAVTVNTLQALSGAGYPGVPSVAVLGNVIPFIAGEEEKMRVEPLEILQAEFPISVAVHRVPVIDGHTMTVFVKLKKRTEIALVRRAMELYVGKPPSPDLPSAPRRPLHVLEERDRPQPARDAMRCRGMVVSVGRIRRDPVYDACFTLVVHNTLRGAAGAAILNAELLVATHKIRGLGSRRDECSAKRLITG